MGPNSDTGQDPPPEKLTIAFATADVVITGWRLARIADLLRDGSLLALRPLPTRYAALDLSKPAIVSIAVELIYQGIISLLVPFSKAGTQS